MRQAFRVAVLCAGMIAIVVLVFAAMHGKGLRVAAASQAPPVTSASEPKSQRLFCGLWRLDGGFASTAHIKNLLLTGPLAVSPVIYMADGTEYALPTVTIDPSGLADVSVGDALNNASPKIRAHISQFGSMALTFTSASAVNVVAGVEILNLEQSLIFVVPFQAVGAMGHGAMPAGDHILDAVWWKHDTGVKAFVALSNASDSPKVVSVEVSGSEGSLRRTDATVRPKNTNMIDVEQLIADLPEAERSTGGIRVRYSGQMSEIRATAGLMNDSEGYSANVEFQPHSANTSGPIAMSYASVGIMAGLPDPRMGFPKGSTFSPYAAIRNPTNHPLDAAPVLYLMAGSTVKKLSLPAQHLAAGEAKQLPLLQPLSNFNGLATLVMSYVGNAHDLLIATGSVDQTATFVFTVAPALVTESWAKYDPYWNVTDGFDAMMSVFNPGGTPEDIVANLTYVGGSGHYAVPLHLVPGETQMLDVRQLIEAHQADADGNFIPFDVEQGSAQFAGSEGPSEAINVAIAAGVFNVQTATCGQVICPVCVITESAFIGPSPVLTPIGGSQQATFVLHMSDGTSVDKTSTAHWSSANTSVGTVSAGLVKGIAAGATQLTAFVLGPGGESGEPEPECPATCLMGEQTGDGPLTVEEPARLVFFNTSCAPFGQGPLQNISSGSVVDCGGETRTTAPFCGVNRNLTYQLVDQAGDPFPFPYLLSESFSNHITTNPALPLPTASQGVPETANGIVTDAQFIGFTFPKCLAANDHHSYIQNFTATVDGQVFPLTTTVSISVGNFNGIPEDNVNITIP